MLALLFAFPHNIFAKRRPNTNEGIIDGKLIFQKYFDFSSMSRHHISHASHASHASHYSMMFATKTDSINHVSAEIISVVKTSLAQEYNCDYESVEIKHIYISSNSEIYKSHNGYRGNPFITIYAAKGDEKCLFISYKIMSDIENGHRHMLDGGEYLIPISNPENSVFYFIKHQLAPQKIEIGDLEAWMKKILSML